MLSQQLKDEGDTVQCMSDHKALPSPAVHVQMPRWHLAPGPWNSDSLT